uniref:Uncharacterized protein n=1 Tax=Moschus moschiferus TaxID=68415 RepID=A0A8C6G2P7_MOSMO
TLRDSGSAEVGWAPAGPGGAILAGGNVGQRTGHARPGLRQVPGHPPGAPARWTEATSPCAPAAVRAARAAAAGAPPGDGGPGAARGIPASGRSRGREGGRDAVLKKPSS